MGDWGLGIGDWGLCIADCGLATLPNPQSPIPNPQSPIPNNNIINIIFKNIFYSFKISYLMIIKIELKFKLKNGNSKSK